MKKSLVAIVEDEQSLLQVLSEYLKEEGYEVVKASTGKMALEVIPKDLPDLIILDLILPEISGYEVMKQLKSDQKTSSIPIIILSNLGDEWDRKRALKLGAVDYLVKAEHDLDFLVKKIQQYLNKNN